MLKRAVAGVAVTGLCVAATSQLDLSPIVDSAIPGKQVERAIERSGADETLTSFRLATGLSRPVFVTNDGVNPDWICRRAAFRFNWSNQDSRSNQWQRHLDIPVRQWCEHRIRTGLLGMCFDPDYEAGYFYVNYTRSNTTYITRYTRSLNPQTADFSSATVVYSTSTYSNHWDGWTSPRWLLYSWVTGVPVAIRATVPRT